MTVKRTAVVKVVAKVEICISFDPNEAETAIVALQKAGIAIKKIDAITYVDVVNSNTKVTTMLTKPIELPEPAEPKGAVE